jgi:hypothetical protein
MTSLVVFAFLSYGLVFLYAEAGIFGCGATAYKESISENPPDLEYIRSKGILRIRHHLLRFHFFQEQMGCFFCSGFWLGPVAHLALYYLLREGYIFYHPDELPLWLLSFPVASVLGGVSAMVVDSTLDVLWALKAKLEGPTAFLLEEDPEVPDGHPEDT